MHPDDIAAARALKAKIKAFEWGKSILTVEPTFDGQAYRVTFRPVSAEAEAELDTLRGRVQAPLSVRAAEVIHDRHKTYLVLEITGAEA